MRPWEVLYVEIWMLSRSPSYPVTRGWPVTGYSDRAEAWLGGCITVDQLQPGVSSVSQGTQTGQDGMARSSLSLLHSNLALLDYFRLPRRSFRHTQEVKSRLYCQKVRLPSFLWPVYWLTSFRSFPGVPPSDYIKQVSPPVSHCLNGDLTVFLWEEAFVY
jgi:hypothetical protein